MDSDAGLKSPVYRAMGDQSECDARKCRICLETQPAHRGAFVAPCRCSGSMRWVHQACLRQWRITSSRADSFWRCEQCATEYQFHMSTALHALKGRRVEAVVAALVFVLSFALAFAMAARLVMTQERMILQRLEQLYPECGWDAARIDSPWADGRWGLSPRTIDINSCATLNSPNLPTSAPMHRDGFYTKAPRRVPADERPAFEKRSALTSIIESIASGEFMRVLPLAIAMLGGMALVIDGSTGSCVLAFLLAFSTTGLYCTDWTWMVWPYPVPAAYGIVRYATGVRRLVRDTLSLLTRFACTDLRNYCAISQKRL